MIVKSQNNVATVIASLNKCNFKLILKSQAHDTFTILASQLSAIMSRIHAMK